jgi:vacuolar-type H+-ATPase subunit C/Vma6
MKKYIFMNKIRKIKNTPDKVYLEDIQAKLVSSSDDVIGHRSTMARVVDMEIGSLNQVCSYC